MKKLLLLLLLMPMLSFSQRAQEPTQIETIEVENGYVKYSRDSGTVIMDLDVEDKTMYEIKSPIRFQEGNIYVFYLKVRTCIDCPTIEAELIGHTVAVKQTEKNIANMRAKLFKETPKQ